MTSHTDTDAPRWTGREPCIVAVAPDWWTEDTDPNIGTNARREVLAHRASAIWLCETHCPTASFRRCAAIAVNDPGAQGVYAGLYLAGPTNYRQRAQRQSSLEKLKEIAGEDNAGNKIAG